MAVYYDTGEEVEVGDIVKWNEEETELANYDHQKITTVDGQYVGLENDVYPQNGNYAWWKLNLVSKRKCDPLLFDVMELLKTAQEKLDKLMEKERNAE